MKKYIILPVILASQLFTAEAKVVIDYGSGEGYSIYGENKTASEFRVDYWDFNLWRGQRATTPAKANSSFNLMAKVFGSGRVIAFHKQLDGGKEELFCDYEIPAGFELNNYWEINIVSDNKGDKGNCSKIIKVGQLGSRGVTPFLIGYNMTNETQIMRIGMCKRSTGRGTGVCYGTDYRDYVIKPGDSYSPVNSWSSSYDLIYFGFKKGDNHFEMHRKDGQTPCSSDGWTNGCRQIRYYINNNQPNEIKVMSREKLLKE